MHMNTLTLARQSLFEYAAVHTMDEFLSKALDEIGALVDSPIGFYHFVGSDQKSLSLQQWSTRTLNEFCQAKGKGLHYSIEQAGVWADCIREKKPVIHNDYHSLEHKKGMPEGHAMVVRELAAPVMREGKVVAILGVGNKPVDYTEKDAETLAFLADVTWEIVERMRAEEVQRESAEIYSAIVNQAIESIVLVDAETLRLKEFNDAACNGLGYSREEFARLTLFDLQATLTREEVTERVREVVEEGHAQFENQHRRKDGTLRDVLISNRVIYIRDRKCLVGLWHDITERKRAEEALRQSEWEKSTLNKIANIFLMVPDENVYEEVLAVILKALKSRYGIFGYIGDNGELIVPSMTKDVWSTCQVEGKSIVFPQHLWGNSLWGKSINQRTSFYSKGPFRTPEGHLPIFNFLTVPIVFAGKTIGLASVANKEGDFTEEDRALLERIADNISPILNARRQRDGQELDRKDAEKALRASEERLAGIIDFLPDATFAINSEGIVIAWNRAIEEMTGVPKEAMLGKGNLEYALSFYGERRRLLVDLVFASEEEIQRDYQAVSKLGNTIVAEAFVPGTFGGKGADLWGIATALYDRSGKVSAAIESIRDVSERKLAEDTLKRAEARYRAIFENAMEGIFQTTPEGSYITANPAHAKMLGFDSPDELLQSATDIGLQIYADPGRRMEIRRLLTQNNFIKDYHVQLLRKDGSRIWVTIDCITIRDSEGEIVCFQGSMLDITDSMRAAEEREKLEAQLFHAQKMESVGRLAGGVAHDFNNMLSIILGHSELSLKGMSPSDRLHNHLEIIQDAALRSADLVRQLLAFARRQIANPKLLDLNETIESMLKMLRRLIGEDIDLVWMPGSGLWHVRMDPSQIDQILANLTVNARDAISGVGSITIETQNIVLDDSYCSNHVEIIPGEYVQLTVSDSGCGMDREVLDRLFEPFFTTKDLGRGTGLGLATVYGIVKQNDGFIHVYSEPSNGATFKIYLPGLKAENENVREEAAEVEQPQKGTETVLLVEDDPALLDLSKTILEFLGYTVITTESPKEAILIVESHAGEIQLLITDVVMPEMNGQELAERLQVIQPTLKCLFMSGYTANMIAHRGILDEGIHFISKPFKMNDLAKAVRAAMAQK
jgi:PAS domain S-box-containing protein